MTTCRRFLLLLLPSPFLRSPLPVPTSDRHSGDPAKNNFCFVFFHTLFRTAHSIALLCSFSTEQKKKNDHQSSQEKSKLARIAPRKSGRKNPGSSVLKYTTLLLEVGDGRTNDQQTIRGLLPRKLPANRRAIS